ncbi:MAG: Fic family protein [Flammeovirgaceae bacterium]
MNPSAHFSILTPIFHHIPLPEEGYVVGYAAIINRLALAIPMHQPIALVSIKNRSKQIQNWRVFSKRYLPDDHQGLTEIQALYKHLVFALKYEGINLLVFSALTKHYTQEELLELVNIEPTGQYSRRIWFLVEWLIGSPLEEKKALYKKKYIPVVNTNHQYAVEGVKSPRHLVINNLPGTPNFCPLIYKTEKLENYIQIDLFKKQSEFTNELGKDILQRAAAFLLLKDSKASFVIEGENAKNKRAMRWGTAIGQAGLTPLNQDELLRLQQLVIEDTRFITLGFRNKGGFIGEHDRITGEPIPEHISAKWKDVKQLIDGLLQTNQLLLNSNMDAVLIATVIAFGFVFIHPFEDGNGRIHRYLIHHILAKKHFTNTSLIFPISASILDHITDYSEVLKSYSKPLLNFIEWQETEDHNVEVLNNTIDYYRYFDGTQFAEFLYDRVQDTIKRIIPNEIQYLHRYDTFKQFIDAEFEMPDKLVATLVRFLTQNNGQLSKRAKEKEFKALHEEEIKRIELKYKDVFE